MAKDYFQPFEDDFKPEHQPILPSERVKAPFPDFSKREDKIIIEDYPNENILKIHPK